MADKYNPGMEFQSWTSLPGGALSELGQGLKTGLLLYGLQKTGLIDKLNDMGMKKDSGGGWSYQPPAPSKAAVPPVSTAAAAPAPIAPPQPEAPGAIAAPVAPQNTIESQPLPSMNPSDLGKKLLDEEWHGGFMNTNSMFGMA